MPITISVWDAALSSLVPVTSYYPGETPPAATATAGATTAAGATGAAAATSTGGGTGSPTSTPASTLTPTPIPTLASIPDPSTPTTSTTRSGSASDNSNATGTSVQKGGNGLSGGAIAGIVVGIIGLLALCALFGFFLKRRRRQKSKRNSASYQNAEGLQQAPVATADVSLQNPIAWHEQPKDDESMLRLYKEVNGRLTDHVLNFYVVSDGEAYDDEISKLPKDARRDLETRVSRLTHLLPRQDSRMFVLRAIIANRVVRAASEEAEAQKIASLDSRQGVYDNDSRDRMILRLAQVAHDETRAFAIANSNSEARLRSMEIVTRTAVDFAFTMAKQPTRFEFIWALPTTEGSSVKAVFDPQTMEAVHQASREEQSAAVKVRATVFPGLRKWRKDEESLLAKTQVLLY